MASITDRLTEIFTKAGPGGGTIPAGFVDVLVGYLVDSVKVKEPKDVDLEFLYETASEAYAEMHDGGKLPAQTAAAIKKWVGVAKKPVKASSLASVTSEDGTEDEDDEIDHLFGAAGPTTRDLAKLAEDKKTHGFSGMRIVCLSVALELGRVPAPGEVAGSVFYGCDVRITDIAKKQKKAGVSTMQRILDGENVRLELNQHIVDVVRDYSERTQIQEASRITQWWAETQSLSQDDTVIQQYLLEYFKKYPGRGLPVTVDVLIAQRVLGKQAKVGGASTEQIKSIVAQLKTLQSELASTKSSLASTRNELNQLKAAKNPGPGGLGRNPNIVCRACGEKGHIEANCPNNKGKGNDKDTSKEEKDE